MTWELVSRVAKSGFLIGTFSVRKRTITPTIYSGKNYNWYIDRKNLVAKLTIEKKGTRKVSTTVNLPQSAVDMLKDDQYIVFTGVEEMYFSSYTKGQEALEKFLKTEGITVRH